MPKIPIDFSLGSYEDVNDELGSRINYNCYPETTGGAVNKTVLRSVEGYSPRYVSTNAEVLNAALFVDEVLYFVASNKLYSSIQPYTSVTLIGTIGTSSPVKMVSNGKNIVIIALLDLAPTNDYYYDISGGTLATIASKDADYTSFGKARDVVFKDGYYLFITEQALFHGDNVSTGDGITFNPLSFAAIPARSGDGTGLEVANGVVYAFTREKTYLYQTAGTTPFSFARSINQEIDIGLTWANAKVSFEDRIFLIANKKGATQKAMIIAGTSYQDAGNQSVNERLDEIASSNYIQVSTYEYRSHRFVQVADHITSIDGDEAAVFDFTETSLKGYPVWHYRAMPSGSSGFGRQYITLYLEPSRANPSYNGILAMGATGAFRRVTIYTLEKNQAFGNSNVFGLSLSDQNRMQYTFPFIRQNSDAVSLNKISLRFTDGVAKVELQRSTEENIYYSLGVVDLTNVESKTAEWRRLGLIERDVSFRIIYSTDYVISSSAPEYGNKAASLIEGYIET